MAQRRAPSSHQMKYPEQGGIGSKSQPRIPHPLHNNLLTPRRHNVNYRTGSNTATTSSTLVVVVAHKRLQKWLSLWWSSSSIVIKFIQYVYICLTVYSYGPGPMKRYYVLMLLTYVGCKACFEKRAAKSLLACF
jgi:hypothetical protein